MKIFKFFLFALFLMAIMTGCKEEEFSNSGTLNMSFTNHPSDIYVTIFALDNLDIPIDMVRLDNNGTAVRDLNVGNYYIRVSSSTFLAPLGFQIKSNSTTTIVWGADNVARIQ